MTENTDQTFARALVGLFNEIDGPADEQTARDYRLTNKYWPAYLAAKELLDKGDS